VLAGCCGPAAAWPPHTTASKWLPELSQLPRSSPVTGFAALDVASGRVIGSVHRRHRAIEFRKFLAKIDTEVPGDLEIHLICDNLSTHKTPAIAKWLQTHPRFHLHFTPTSSSWLNQVERWFGLLTDKQLRRSTHKSVQALEKDIRTWVTTWNENPKPFVWTKTADEIFERLKTYLQRIPGAGH
jgi:transposase